MAIPEIKLNYKIQYRITGYAQIFETEAYAEDEVQYQKEDIAGYEGVYGVNIVPVHDESDGAITGQVE